MSEHWKSTPKYWCKHCTIYVKDTAFERKQHESTGKHRSSLKRFLTGIQKDHLKSEQEKERTKAEVERLNRITGAHGSNETPVESSKPPSKSAKATVTALSAEDQKRQWAQLAQMGIAIPDQARAEMAIPGEWSTVAAKAEIVEHLADNNPNIGVKKRKFEQDEDEEESEEVVAHKGWGSRTKQYPGDHEPPSADLDALLAETLSKKVQKDVQKASRSGRVNALPDTATNPSTSGDGIKSEAIDASNLLSTVELEESDSTETTSTLPTLQSSDGLDAGAPSHKDPALEPSAPVFKKRKAKSQPTVTTL